MGTWYAILHIFYVVCILEFSVLFVGGGWGECKVFFPLKKKKFRYTECWEFLLLLHKGTPGKQ